METVFIYGLKDPRDGQIKYIGKTNKPEQRLRGHLADKGYSAKTMWLDHLRAEGLDPELVVLDDVPVATWRRAEQHWINKGLAMGWPLTNREGQTEEVGHRSLGSIKPYLSEELWLAFHELSPWEKVAIGDAIAAVGMFFSEPEAMGIGGKPVIGLGFYMAQYFAHLLVRQKVEGKPNEFAAVLNVAQDMAARVDLLAAEQQW